ncbi:MAG: GTPase HflX [Verrucomicrobiota bacterium]
MKALIDIATKRTRRVFLIGAELKARTGLEVKDSLAELAELAVTAGAVVVGQGAQKMETPTSGTYIGRGKAEEFAKFCEENNVDTIIFDDELSSSQGRNLEQIFGCKILDRTALILEIFGQRARTREGKLQVELAQLEYLLPRLTRFWSHLSRQAGGIGMRAGEGESQLESDRRRTQERIDTIREELDHVRNKRATQRNGRQRNLWPLASIVGYTNAGKSTLLNTLTGASVLAEDKLFATLDPTTRRLHLPTNQNVLLSDTVGFIRKLPHGLVQAFKATLEEVVQADLLLHVADLSHPQAKEQILAVNEVLNEIGAAHKPILMVFNKLDRFEDRGICQNYRELFPNSVFLSAKTGEGVAALLAELGIRLRPVRLYLELAIPHSHAHAISILHQAAQITDVKYGGPKARFKVRIPPHLRAEFEPYIVNDLTATGTAPDAPEKAE